MISRILLLILIVLVIFPSAAADRFREGSSDCLGFPAQQGLVTNVVRIVLRTSGIVETSADITFKACRIIGVRRISLRRPAAYFDYGSDIVVVQSGERRSIPIENITTESAVPPKLGGGTQMQFHYLIPAFLPGDELHEMIRASAPPILSGNQVWIDDLRGIQDAFTFDVMSNPNAPM